MTLARAVILIRAGGRLRVAAATMAAAQASALIAIGRAEAPRSSSFARRYS
jgi:hypothetical protein